MNPFTSPGGLALLLAVKGNANSAMETLNMSTIPLLDSVVPVIADIRRHKGRFKCMFGGVITTFKEYVSDYRNEIDFREPITILKQHITQQGLRLIDFFKQLDKDGSGSISRDEFVFGLKELNVPLTTSQLDRLIADMDTNCDGEVDYGELIVADTEYRRTLRKKAAAVAEAEVDS
ncbi:hypothetical protein NP493_562g03016 [Ridgeia piscesae]|uniref:EF-hand domain-containing protein n=1 Tax=Ridgeia piscesae TaxID=27915 RepID=A0AAD9KWL8_RIDPI|nr:hypothetical protein NP493_562g03016 [Ridgeia piscesae]